jgi:hypothetical protein
MKRRKFERVPLKVSGETSRWLEWSGSELRLRGENGEDWCVDAFAASAGLLRPEFAEGELAGAEEEGI